MSDSFLSSSDVPGSDSDSSSSSTPASSLPIPQNTDPLAGSLAPETIPAPSPYLTSVDGLRLVPAEIKDLYEGNELYVRGEKCICQRFDYPHVYWRTFDMEPEAEKHRSYTTSAHIFGIDPATRERENQQGKGNLSGGGGGGGAGYGSGGNDGTDEDFLPPPPPPSSGGSNETERFDQHQHAIGTAADRANNETPAEEEQSRVE